jgi:hypothetical protein
MNDDRGMTQTRRPPMLRRFTDLRNYTIGAVDGDIGSIHDLFLDEQDWTVRHLVVDTGRWLSGRKVLISPMAIAGLDPSGLRVLTRLTTAQVKDAPDIDTDAPVSRQHEIQLAAHYGVPEYWQGPFRWGASPFPYVYGDVGPVGLPVVEPRASAVREEIVARVAQEGDPHLHSARAVAGLGLRATDGDLGHVEDFLVDDAAWVIRYLIVDPRNWWPGHHVLLATDWVTAVQWDDRRVEVDVSREAVRQAPPYDPPSWVVERDWEQLLHGAYGRRGYWEEPADTRRRRPAA